MIDTRLNPVYPNRSAAHSAGGIGVLQGHGVSRIFSGFFMPIVQTSFMADWAEQPQGWPGRDLGTPTPFSPSPVIGVARGGLSTCLESRP